MKFANFIFNLIKITVLLFAILSFIFIILKAIGATDYSWFQVLAPSGLVFVMFFLPALIIFVWDNYFS